MSAAFSALARRAPMLELGARVICRGVGLSVLLPLVIGTVQALMPDARVSSMTQWWWRLLPLALSLGWLDTWSEWRRHGESLAAQLLGVSVVRQALWAAAPVLLLLLLASAMRVSHSVPLALLLEPWMALPLSALVLLFARFHQHGRAATVLWTLSIYVALFAARLLLAITFDAPALLVGLTAP